MHRCTTIFTSLLATALTCLNGCMVGPDYEPPASTLPPAYAELDSATPATQPEPEDARWWRQFDDPQLTVLVERAIGANHAVAVAEARLREARAGRQMVRSLLYPRVSVGASVLRFRGSQAGLDAPDGFLDLDGELFQVGFDAVWAVDLFGGIRRSVESAEAHEQATNSLRRGVVLMVAAETARAYVELRGVQRELLIARVNLTDQRQTLSVTEDRLKNGLASDLEVLRARTEVESTASEIPPLESAIRQYIHVLSVLLGQQPTALSEELEATEPIPGVPGQMTVGIPSDLLRRRPDIQAAERQLAGATALVGVATAALFPQVVLGTSAGFASRKPGDLLNGGDSPSSTFYAAGPTVDWTLFDGGRRKAGVDLAEAQVDAVKAAYEDTVLRAFREVESGLVAVERSRARVKDLERLAASAREAASIARRDYERGILDQLTVLDAQRQSNRAEMLLIQGQMTLTVNMVSLYKALGGGWEAAEPANQDTTGAATREGE